MLEKRYKETERDRETEREGKTDKETGTKREGERWRERGGGRARGGGGREVEGGTAVEPCAAICANGCGSKWRAYLEQPGEDVELEHRDVVVEGEVYGGLEGHGFQPGADGVELMQGLSEGPPGHDGPARTGRTSVTTKQVPTVPSHHITVETRTTGLGSYTLTSFR